MLSGTRTKRARARGFTLFELMIAVGVLLLAVLTTFQTQVASDNLMRTARETDTGSSDLQAAMEQILLRPPDQIPVPVSPFAANQPIAAFEDLHLRQERIVPTYAGYAGGAIVPDPLSIRLTLTWLDYRGRPRTMQLACMRTR